MTLCWRQNNGCLAGWSQNATRAYPALIIHQLFISSLCITKNLTMTLPNLPPAVTPREHGTKPPSSSTTRIQISIPPASTTTAVSNRGRKKPTPASAAAPRRPPLHPAPASNDVRALTPTPNTNAAKISKKKNKKKRKGAMWPSSSADSLPPLSDHLLAKMQDKNLVFPLNEECK